ncbi:MAG: DUF547 domain-containing protein [Armatimonadota bacterium]
MDVQETRPRSFVPGAILAGALVAAGIVGLAIIFRAPTKPTPDSQRIPAIKLEAPAPFDYASFSRVLEKRVNDLGMVDYAGIKAAPADLDAFIAQLKEDSPDNNLAMFASEDEALAYWINAYNAWMIKIIADHYPVASVQDIGDRPGAVFEDKLCVCGGKKMSLNDIEVGIIRARYLEPRIHFALNCASLGCPPLPRKPFLPDTLDAQLEAAARDFFGRKWYCRVADDGRTVAVTSILDWYREDFLDWLTENGQNSDIATYVALYAPDEVRRAIATGAEIEFMDYDWRLTDQAATWANVQRR